MICNENFGKCFISICSSVCNGSPTGCALGNLLGFRQPIGRCALTPWIFAVYSPLNGVSEGLESALNRRLRTLLRNLVVICCGTHCPLSSSISGQIRFNRDLTSSLTGLLRTN